MFSLFYVIFIHSTHMDANCCFERIPDVTLYKRAAVRPLTTHLKEPSKLNEQDMLSTARDARTHI